MATGMTCDIENGQAFDEFVRRCARCMGAFIHMRDCASNARIDMPESEDKSGERHREHHLKAVENL